MAPMKNVLRVALLATGLIGGAHAEITYSLSGGIPTNKLAAITSAMDGACYHYNLYSDYDKDVYVYYSDGIPTAQASLNGPIGFGGSISTKTAIHEMGHVMGVGTYWAWDNFASNWMWSGHYANETLQRLDGNGAKLGVDGTHFWPYGLNYNWEDPKKHVLLIGAMRQDMGMSNRTKPEYNVLFEVPHRIFFEAEWGALHNNFAPFSVESSEEASNGLYVDWIGDGTLNDTSPANTDPGKLFFPFTLNTTCDVRVEAVVNFPDNKANSIYVKMDDSAWELFAIDDEDVTNAFINVGIGTFNQLAAGTHTLKILKREDGAKIDSLTLYPHEYSNVASGKVAVADSQHSETYSAERAVDGDSASNDSRWLSANTPFPHWIEIDLGGEYDISHMALWNGYNGYNNGPSHFQFQQWEDGQWVDIFAESGSANSKYNRGFPTVTTSKVRLYITGGANQQIRLYELEVFGFPHMTDAAPALKIDMTGAETVLSSPVTSSSFSLQSSGQPGTGWMPTGNTPATADGTNEWQQTSGNETGFYRLIKD